MPQIFLIHSQKKIKMQKKNYRLNLSDRSVDIEMHYAFKKRLTLSIYPDKRVLARIPYGMPNKTVENYFLQKQKWILKHLKYFDENPPETEKKYQEGEIFRFLGKEFSLVIKKGKRHVNLEEENIIVHVSDLHNSEMIKKALLKWYREQAIEIISPIYFEWIKKLSYLKLPQTKLRFYKMKRRWGSCSGNAIITLNSELIKKDPALIDYIIVHEICHLKVPAHNKAFYSLVGSIIPDWKDKRKKLR